MRLKREKERISNKSDIFNLFRLLPMINYMLQLFINILKNIHAQFNQNEVFN